MQDKKAFWLWLLQRITAALIFIVLGVHLYFVHYAEFGEPILYAGVDLRLSKLLPLLVDSMLLLLGLFHGLNGVRTVMLDFAPFSKHDRLISWILFLVGLIFFLWGGQVLLKYINMRL